MQKMLAVVEEAANAVFEALGSGLTEACYQNALAIELRMRGHEVETESLHPITYAGTQVGFVRLDILLDKSKTNPIILEIKAVAKITDSHKQQIGAYLKHVVFEKREAVGILINFSSKKVEVVEM